MDRFEVGNIDSYVLKGLLFPVVQIHYVANKSI